VGLRLAIAVAWLAGVLAAWQVADRVAPAGPVSGDPATRFTPAWEAGALALVALVGWLVTRRHAALERLGAHLAVWTVFVGVNLVQSYDLVAAGLAAAAVMYPLLLVLARRRQDRGFTIPAAALALAQVGAVLNRTAYWESGSVLLLVSLGVGVVLCVVAMVVARRIEPQEPRASTRS
jgi:hypothetical protein